MFQPETSEFLHLWHVCLAELRLLHFLLLRDDRFHFVAESLCHLLGHCAPRRISDSSSLAMRILACGMCLGFWRFRHRGHVPRTNVRGTMAHDAARRGHTTRCGGLDGVLHHRLLILHNALHLRTVRLRDHHSMLFLEGVSQLLHLIHGCLARSIRLFLVPRSHFHAHPLKLTRCSLILGLLGSMHAGDLSLAERFPEQHFLLICAALSVFHFIRDMLPCDLLDVVLGLHVHNALHLFAESEGSCEGAVACRLVATPHFAGHLGLCFAAHRIGLGSLRIH